MARDVDVTMENLNSTCLAATDVLDKALGPRDPISHESLAPSISRQVWTRPTTRKARLTHRDRLTLARTAKQQCLRGYLA